MKQPEFRTVKQPENTKVCGAAIVAMALGWDLDEAEENMVPTYLPDGSYFYKTREVLRLLGGHGIQCGLMLVPLDGDDFRFEPGMDVTCKFNMADVVALLVVKSITYPGKHHWILWDGPSQKVHDPSPAVKYSKLTDYEIVDVIPLTYLDESDEDNEGDWDEQLPTKAAEEEPGVSVWPWSV